LKRRAVKRFRSPEALAAWAAALFERTLRAKRGRPLLTALPGGRTPLPLFDRLAAMTLPWENAVFFMSDERVVPFSSPKSNFGSARRGFFSRTGIPRANLRPALSAAALEKALLKDTGGTGRLDLVFLGLGEDGHTASLFPGARAPRGGSLAAAAEAPPGITPRKRITLTLEALNRAGTVVLMAAGPAKKEIFRRAAAGDKELPAGRLRPRGELYLLFSEKD